MNNKKPAGADLNIYFILKKYSRNLDFFDHDGRSSKITLGI